jgi:ribosomal protein L29
MADKKQQSKATDTLEDLRKLDNKALETKVAELKKELVEQHRANAAQELPNPAVIGKTRKQIARALTLLQANKQATPPAADNKEEDK